MSAEPSPAGRYRLAQQGVAAVSVGVLLAYVACAARLIRYPWDWSPDEGLFLDWGRRALQHPATLYAHSWVPFPAAYGPGMPVLLAPLTTLGMQALPAARLMALLWTAGSAVAVYLLARPAGALLGLAAAAMSIAAFDLTSYTMLIRPDGPMIALWLFAAMALLPARLEPGADCLGAGRLAAGTALLLLGTLTKLTFVLHAAPLVVAWTLVDRRSATRLTGVLVIGGALVVAALEWATSGGYLWANGVWLLHGTQPGLPRLILAYMLERAWPYVALVLAALALAWTRRREALREAALVLVAGALLVIPLLSKFGASWNYMLPLLPALAVLAARWGALAARGRPGLRLVPAATIATVAALLALTRAFPVPTPLDERTANAFYGFVAEHTRRSGGPILALRPELAYFVVGQPVEMEGSCFVALAQRGAPGCERILGRLQNGAYTLVVRLHEMPGGEYSAATAARYVHAGGCNLSFYFGTAPVHLFTRRDLPLYMAPPAGTRCGGAGS